MNNSLPETIHFQITSKCNNNCKHCFGPNQNTPEMNVEQISEMIGIISENGAKNVHLTGGEPTLRKNFGEIIRLLKKRKLKLFLDTNCDFFFLHEKVISRNIDVIGLPIDFSIKSWRNNQNLKNVLKVLDFYQNKKIKPKIRILTTATKENIEDLRNIGDLIKKYHVDIWRIFQFLPLDHSNAKLNKKALYITKREFLEKTRRIKRIFSKHQKINLVPIGHRNHAYFIIASDGKVMIPTESKKICENKVVGTITQENIIDQWSKHGSKLNFEKSMKEIFDLIG